MVAPATAATLNGNSSMVTTITATMAMANSFRKCVMECSTACGISAILAICTSGDILPFSDSSVSSTVLPKETMLFPGCISSDISRLFVPLFLMMASGLGYSLTTRATSFTLITLPLGSV